MSSYNSVRSSSAAVHVSDSSHPSLHALETFRIPFICYTTGGARHHISPAAEALLAVATLGGVLGAQADRMVAEEIGRETLAFSTGSFTFVRESLGANGITLALHLVRSVPRQIGAVVVLRPSAASITLGALPGLTARESDVARLLGAGLCTKEIAAQLGISGHTARHHTERVFAKLGVRCRAAVAALLATRAVQASPTVSNLPS